MLQIAENIKLIRGLAGMTQVEFAQFISENLSNLKTYETKGIMPKPHIQHRIAKIGGISKDDLLNKTLTPDDIQINLKVDKVEKVPRGIITAPNSTVAEPDEIPYTKKRREIKNSTPRKAIPFYDAPAAAGITETEMTAIHAPAGTIDVGDLLSDSQAAIRIYGNSMLPNYPPGCVVGLARCDSLMIEPGEVYVIETRTRRILKRLFYPNDQPESEKITCYSDNTMKFEGGARDGLLAYPPYDLPKQEIINLFVVTGVIKRNANSVIINR